MNIPIPSQSSRNHINDRVALASATSTKETINLGRVVELILRRLWVVIAVFLLGLALSAGAGFVLMPNYTATALLSVQTPANKDIRADDASAIDTHITMLKSDGFLARVVTELAKENRLGPTPISLANLRRHTNVMQELKSSLISINETAKSPTDAAIIANTIAASYVDGLMAEASTNRTSNIIAAEQQLEAIDAKIKAAVSRLADPATSEANRLKERATLAALQSTRGDLTVAIDLAQRQAAEQVRSEISSPAVRIAAHAETPERPSSINPLLLVVPGAFVSLIAGIALALTLSRLDRRLQTTSDVVEYFNAPSLDIAGESFAAEKTTSNLMIALLSAFGDRQKRIVVTSSHDRDGKDQLVEEIARSAARLRPSVLVVDLESSSVEPQGIVYRLAGAQFDRMNCHASFRTDSMPAPDLRLRDLIAQTSLPYEWIIVSAPPVLQAPAVRLLVDWMSLGVLAARAGSTSKAQIREALHLLTPDADFGVPHAELPRFIVALTHARGIASSLDANPVLLRQSSTKENVAVHTRRDRVFCSAGTSQTEASAIAGLNTSTATSRGKE